VLLYKLAVNYTASHSVANLYSLILLLFALTYHHTPQGAAFFNWGNNLLSG
jgi:hypothetical protein